MMVSEWIDELLAERLGVPALEWSGAAREEIAAGVTDVRFATLISAASRHARRRPAEPAPEAIARAGRLVMGWNPERWSLLDLLRAGLVLAREDLDRETGPAALLGAFAFADVGELCALYRTLPLLPRQEDFLWQAGEGCRSNMTEVFEAVACDSPYAARHFDEVAWRALVIKAIFIDAPLWRVFGLDGRLSEELARMALDLADERRSAARPVQPQLWLCPGSHGGARALESMQHELELGPPAGRSAAAYGLARAEHLGPVADRLALETEPTVVDHLRNALAGKTDQTIFRAFDSTTISST